MCFYSACQSQLPATGVPVTRQHSDQMKQMLHAYIKDRTNQNWKFYVFSQIATPLFDSFNSIVSTASVEELYRTTQTWLDQHCTLLALRPGQLHFIIHHISNTVLCGTHSIGSIFLIVCNFEYVAMFAETGRLLCHFRQPAGY